MASHILYKRRGFTIYRGDEIRSKVAFVVEVRDAVSNEMLRNNLFVRIQNRQRIVPVKNPSGFYCFTNLPGGEYEVIVEPEGPFEQIYLPGTGVIDTGNLVDELNPILLVALQPGVLYPFLDNSRANATLLSGEVKSGGQNPSPVEEATVTATYTANGSAQHKMQTTTRTDGTFELFFYAPFFTGDETTRIVDVEVFKMISGNERRRSQNNITITKEQTTMVNFAGFPSR